MRIDCEAVLPDATRALRELDRVADRCGLEPRLLELVRMRASQLNNCAYCLDIHSKDARALGEDEQRLHLLATWRDADAHVYGARERTALEWCEALTLLPERGASHEAYIPLKAEFDEREVVALTMAITAINAWNRFALGFRWPVGDYVSDHPHPAPSSTGENGHGAGRSLRGGLWDA
jgi:AhpD family alkylhydroperoxidase